jgi:hypothetical protein
MDKFRDPVIWRFITDVRFEVFTAVNVKNAIF